jgi:hypothetical protein
MDKLSFVISQELLYLHNFYCSNDQNILDAQPCHIFRLVILLIPVTHTAFSCTTVPFYCTLDRLSLDYVPIIPVTIFCILCVFCLLSSSTAGPTLYYYPSSFQWNLTIFPFVIILYVNLYLLSPGILWFLEDSNLTHFSFSKLSS